MLPSGPAFQMVTRNLENYLRLFWPQFHGSISDPLQDWNGPRALRAAEVYACSE
jgi:hypothetical protein